MGLTDRFRRAPAPAPERSDPAISIDDWARLFEGVFTHQGIQYTYGTNRQEDIGGNYGAMASGAYKGNGIVFACVSNRVDLFSEARFMFRRLRSSRPGGLFGTPELEILNKPWPGATTGDLLARMLLHHDLAGNAYVVRLDGKLAVLRPDWVTIIGGVPDSDASIWSAEAEVLGYAYQEGGPSGGNDPEIYLPEQVAHFATRPDPLARFRGMSWITPVVREIMGDKAATEHKLKFFENAATPNLAVKLDINDLEKFKGWIAEFKRNHEGASHAYETMFLAAGADPVVIGKDFQQLEFKVTQGAGETRIAAAAGVPPVIVGLSEGLAAATYSNYGQARRRFADQTVRPLWRNACGSLARIVNIPPDAELWYDDRDISALQEDLKDRATIQSSQAAAIKLLTDAGYEADSVIAAITADDMTLLTHTGLFSVQLQPPGTGQTDPTTPAPGAADGGNTN